MSEEIQSDTSRIAAAANASFYSDVALGRYGDGAPHLKHSSLRSLYGRLAADVYEEARRKAVVPHVLDLGAGDGLVTLTFLNLGARVTAVDLSESQLDALSRRCAEFDDRVTLRCAEAGDALRVARTRGETCDVIVANSFLHHIPDYLGMIDELLPVLSECGQFFSFQDPLRYDTLGLLTRSVSSASYLTWRVRQADVLGGLRRRWRRHRGTYLADSVHDNAEFHVVRNGVDHLAIEALFRRRAFDCRIVRYFSSHSGAWQPIGELFDLGNTFAVLARRLAATA